MIHWNPTSQTLLFLLWIQISLAISIKQISLGHDVHKISHFNNKIFPFLYSINYIWLLPMYYAINSINFYNKQSRHKEHPSNVIPKVKTLPLLLLAPGNHCIISLTKSFLHSSPWQSGPKHNLPLKSLQTLPSICSIFLYRMSSLSC